jgi:hypothetical protein
VTAVADDRTPADRGQAALADLRRHMDEAGLPRPPVPAVLVPGLQCLGPWHWSTYEERTSPYDHLADVDAAVRAPLDGLVVAHAGHGRQSWAMHYVLTLGPVSVLLQVPFGGMLADPTAAHELEARYRDTEAVLAAAADRVEDGTLGSRRVVVAWSGWHGERAAEVDGEDVRWLPGPAFPAVLDLLEAR